MNKELMFSSAKDDWGTPQAFFDELNALYGFTLDAAADNSNHKCERYYTKEDDGLAQPWDGTVWCNPPYGREIGKWVKKAYEEAKRDKNRFIVMLLPARTDTSWFHEYIYGKHSVEFMRGRLKFVSGGATYNAAPFPSMVVVMRG